MKKFIFLILVPFLLFSGEKSLKVVYISPAQQGHEFFTLFEKFTMAAAKDLNIDFKVAYPKNNTNRYSYSQFAKKIFYSKDTPDVIIAFLFRKRGIDILDFSKETGIPVLIVNSNIQDDDKPFIGEPRKKYKDFLGIISANEREAGELLANSLFIKYRKEKKINEPIYVVGISGTREAYEAIQRNNGLKDSVNKNKNIELQQIVYASWNKDVAFSHSLRLLNRYQNLNVIWTASDCMAIGAKKAVKELNRDVIVGGIDWSKAGIKALEEGNIDVTIGGHFMNGGIALVLLNDYFNGHDFKEELGTKVNFDMSKLSLENIEEYKKNFDSENWGKIDFKKFSKAYNPNLKKYNFSLERFMKNIKLN